MGVVNALFPWASKVHTGSWGLPEFGLTEKAQNVVAPQKAYTPQGGSNLVGKSSTSTLGASASSLGGPQSFPSSQVPTNTTKTTSLSTVSPTTEATLDGGTISDQDYLRTELDAIYAPVFEALNQQKSQVSSEYTNTQADIQGQYGVSQKSLETEKAGGERELARSATEAGSRKEDALTSATRLYNELNKGGMQRFGGASSAGEAFQSLTAVEQQRRQGSIQDAYEGAMQKVTEYKANLEGKYSTALASLEEQKNSSLRDAQTEFNRAMQEIRGNELIAESDKASASLEMLQDLRNKVYTINLQSVQFAQQLALNQEASLKYVDEYTQQALSSVTGGQTAVSNLLPGYQPYSAYSAVSPTNYTQTTAPTGIAYTTKKDEDLYA